MKIINKLIRVLFEILTGVAAFSLLIGIIFGLIYFIIIFKHNIPYILFGVILIYSSYRIGKETLETIEYCKKSNAELKEFKEKYRED